mmetsp:Transcript_13633/g.29536  ORF Transcript_13633/g.29536 Transcript_13633/m.29536 type:complete len:778 (-) Transcript_13633:200-2533(-)|eukprot:CAMPEP_0172535484 /NCGR_PEP_ID=MMETSP1067-20121228/7471_1 /TAXON_ID=265564 ORGANISM="Thalassiosira punctigera, Strain Tpunct2005C2" /NCGR_SAMPLE_ID=MMETSP1067 /ASSEMBLY_ACC=CAM_ASM_000444 /LENGTH=777 /DNA_ID=CAMNT_0013320419 /DNA_START=145 /DNA_END=2478 /DNA_ORIENTATION=+
MVEFGKRLQQECAQHGADWQSHCIDYVALKHIIEKEKEDPPDLSVNSGGADNGQSAGASIAYYHQSDCLLEAYSPRSLRFQYALDREIEKAVLFVLREQGSIAAELDFLAVRRSSLVDGVSRIVSGVESNNVHIRAALQEELGKLHGGYAFAARSVLRFVAFVDLNVTAVRKILKKHDKITKHKLSYAYLSAYTDEYVDSHLDQLYNDGGLSSLVVTLKRAFKELYHLELELMNMKQSAVNQKNQHRRIKSMPASQITGSHFERQQTVEAPPSVGSDGGMTLITTKREPLLQMIQMSRDKLKKNTNYMDIVAAQALMFAEPDDETEAASSASSEMTGSQRLSSLLNLLSTFLYMTNYYIVAPTCGQYAARVGSDESMAGIVIGMTPNAALVATVLYGWWSNHSYKSALVFAAACSFFGNIAYALALSYDSINLILLGRALNGFGSARSINRRFIADTFSRRDRTAASAAFVTAGALGMACGPAIAALLSQLVFPHDSKLWTVETSPGWVMLCMWSLFLIASVFFFEEPDRTHIFGKKSTLELAAKNGEDKFLLRDDPFSGELESVCEPPIWRNVPVMITLWVYFILKLALEALMSSSPILTRYYFGWDAQATGFFLAFLGLLMFPANMIVARLSHRFEDREIIYSSLVAILCGTVGFICYLPSKYTVVQYMTFGICIFISTNALEGPNMSLLSKSIPRSWAKGIFNTGFLATEAGTAARSVGDVWITLASHVAGVPSLLNAIFVPMLGLVAVSLFLVRRNYNQLVEEDDDDDDGKSK